MKTSKKVFIILRVLADLIDTFPLTKREVKELNIALENFTKIIKKNGRKNGVNA